MKISSEGATIPTHRVSCSEPWRRERQEISRVSFLNGVCPPNGSNQNFSGFECRYHPTQSIRTLHENRRLKATCRKTSLDDVDIYQIHSTAPTYVGQTPSSHIRGRLLFSWAYVVVRDHGSSISITSQGRDEVMTFKCELDEQNRVKIVSKVQECVALIDSSNGGSTITVSQLEEESGATFDRRLGMCLAAIIDEIRNNRRPIDHARSQSL